MCFYMRWNYGNGPGRGKEGYITYNILYGQSTQTVAQFLTSTTPSKKTYRPSQYAYSDMAVHYQKVAFYLSKKDKSNYFH